jgi:hypothetical protein
MVRRLKNYISVLSMQDVALVLLALHFKGYSEI